MCFVEYLGYLCGHTSTAVNRPCPMTTHLYTNPCCPKPACRPVLLNTMCHPCTRIIHGRKVNIAECEHRWMHERGACDCEVVFPALQQPRLIHRSSVATGEGGTAPGTETGIAGAGASGSYTGPSQSQQGFPSTSTNSYNGGNRQFNEFTPQHVSNQEECALPLFREARVGENVEVAVRLSSLYAAEWTKDHAQLHQTGQCTCPVSFEKYKPASVENPEDENGSTELAQYNSYPSTSTALAPSYGTYSRAADFSIANSSDETRNPYEYECNQVPAGNVAQRGVNGHQGSLLDDILGPIGPDADARRSQEIQTVHHQREGLPIAGNPIACGPFGESEFASTVEFPQPETTIAGFPIGAGPEGDSHAGDFARCSLLQSNSENSLFNKRSMSSEF